MKTDFALRKSVALGITALIVAFIVTVLFPAAAYALDAGLKETSSQCNYRNLYATEEDNAEPVKSNDTNLALYDLDGSIAHLNSGDYAGKVRVVIAGRPTCGNTNRMINEAMRLSQQPKYADVRFVILDVDSNREAFTRAYATKGSKNLRFCSPTDEAGISYNSWCWTQYRAFSSDKNVMLPFMFFIDQKGNLVNGTAGPKVLTAFIDSIEPATYRFDDVETGRWYATDEVIGYVVDHNLMKGYANTNLFGPNDTLNRAQAIVTLYRMAGEPETAPISFSDVDDNAYFAPAVAWAKTTGVANGYKDASGNGYAFGPYDSVTREQFATMLANYGKIIAMQPAAGSENSLDSYEDATKVAPWSKSSLSWAVEKGIISGSNQNGQKFLDPKGITTRAQAAKMIAMAHKNVFAAPQDALK